MFFMSIDYMNLNDILLRIEEMVGTKKFNNSIARRQPCAILN